MPLSSVRDLIQNNTEGQAEWSINFDIKSMPSTNEVLGKDQGLKTIIYSGRDVHACGAASIKEFINQFIF